MGTIEGTDPVLATIVVAAITATSGLISGLVVAYAKPFAEDRALAKRERRAERRKNLNRIHDMLPSPVHAARIALPGEAAKIGDPKLTTYVESFLAADPESNEREEFVVAARKRVGELIRDV